MKSFTSSNARRKTISFELDGEEFDFRPPKLAGIALDILQGESEEGQTAARAAFDWLSDGLPEEQSDRLVARLRDSDDPLDLPDLVEIIRWLVGKVAGRPSGSRAG